MVACHSSWSHSLQVYFWVSSLGFSVWIFFRCLWLSQASHSAVELFNPFLGTRFAGIRAYPNTVGPCIPCIKGPKFLQDPVVLLGAVGYPFPSASSRRISYLGHIGVAAERLTQLLTLSHKTASQGWCWKREWQAQRQIDTHTLYASPNHLAK